MSVVKGKISLTELKKTVKENRIDTVIIAFTDIYGRFLGKRCDAEFFIEEVAENGSHACDYLLTADMDMEPVAGFEFSNWEKGYGDFHLVPDFQTLRVVSWHEKTALVICDLYRDEVLLPVAPRSILKNQLTRLSELNYEAKAASELEYYLFKNSYENASKQGFQSLEPAGWYIEDYHILQASRQENFHGLTRRHLRDSGVPVENTKGEWGKGQHELNIRYSELLEMSDRHVILKQCLKEVADQQDASVTFMAKYDHKQAGSSCHIHVSLWQEGKNAFSGEGHLGPVKCSNHFRWFLGGWMKHVPEMMLLYAPTINSYKRYLSGSWAPTKIAWSYDNRTAGFRIVGKGGSLRIECRIPGADCNPYLVYAAAIASGLDGIKNQIEPPSIFDGDLYHAKDQPALPETLEEALERFEKSGFVGEAFGEKIKNHLAHFYRNELRSYQRTVSDWERQRYFEQI
ncbi:MAG: glutamine synthetase family protein [Deltaproteobacteria bacterium]|nr:glutamine synthetase family protein [Deltaproteobacteria bacterium]